MKTYKKGDRVQTSGAGRTANWHTHIGTVLRYLSKSSVDVRWDSIVFTDEMELHEIKPLGAANAQV